VTKISGTLHQENGVPVLSQGTK